MLQEAAAATSVELAIEAISETSEGAEIDSSAEAYPTFSAESATVASDGTEVAAVLYESQESQDINCGQWDFFLNICTALTYIRDTITKQTSYLKHMH